MALTGKAAGPKPLAAWPVVADADYGLCDGRSLCQGAGWYCWSQGRTWCGTAQTGPQPFTEYARSLQTWLALQGSASEQFMLMTDASRIQVPGKDLTAVADSVL